MIMIRMKKKRGNRITAEILLLFYRDGFKTRLYIITLLVVFL